jgi:predicted amidohydrolase YtcJ
VKIFVDGGFSARTAATSRPYQLTGETGELYYELEELVTLMVSAAAEGLQVIAHTNGDLAQTLVCEAAFRARRASTDVSVRLEHAGNWVPDFEIVDHWMDAGVTMVSQPGFIYTMGPYFPDLFGSAGRRGLFPYRSLLAAGVPIGASSDVSGSELRHANPMFNVQCAVERIGFGGAVIEADESIDVLTALELQTSQAARAAGIASERGAITRGLVADLVSLSEDPRSLPPGELSRVTVRSVVRDGELALTPAARIG